MKLCDFCKKNVNISVSFPYNSPAPAEIHLYHSENRMRIYLKLNAEKLGECMNKFQQEQENCKEKIQNKY